MNSGEEQKPEHRTRSIRTAVGAITDKGTKAATMREIARGAGLGDATERLRALTVSAPSVSADPRGFANPQPLEVLMDVLTHWNVTAGVVQQALDRRSSCAVATVNPDGSPHVTPIGSLLLMEPGKAVYFEKFPERLRANCDRDPRVCLLIQSGGLWPMLKALFLGRFEAPPGLRLSGRVGPRRQASQEEVRRWRKRIRFFRGLKGYNRLWRNMDIVRDITFDSFEPLRLGVMTRGHWDQPVSH
jgi:hypothetical protein